MTFRVILRKDVIYKNNTGPLCLLFFHDNRKKSVGLGVSVVRSCWDAQAQKVTDDCPDRDDIQFQITAKIKEYERKIKKSESCKTSYGMAEMIFTTFSVIENRESANKNIWSLCKRP